MSNDDLDRTVIMPSPGRRRDKVGDTPVVAPTIPPTYSAPQPAEAEGLSLKMVGSSGQNHLINSATMIFSLARQLRNTTQHGDVEGLLQHVMGLMQQYEKNCINLGIAPDVAYESRYILCAFIDEIVLNTPWGHGSVWSLRSLLSSLHNDTSGGERFFQMLAKKSDFTSQNLVVLELMHTCLCLGFQGKFAIQDNGRAALEKITHGLYRSIREIKPDPEPELSLHWQGVSDGRPAVAKLIPWWVVATVLGGILVLSYTGFFYSLNDESDKVFTDIGKLGREVPQMVQARKSAPSVPLVDPGISSVNIPQLTNKLNDFLNQEIVNRQITVDPQDFGVKITIHNKGLFASGSATVSSSHVDMLLKVAGVIGDLPGPFIVSGHSDSQKIRTLRFPSNWHLSNERAKAIVNVLASGGIDQDKLVAQGKADSNPVASNETPQGREQNRRIELYVKSY
jgi:type VI secretion system protein ImpK